MVQLRPEALAGATPAVRQAIERIAALPSAPIVPSAVSRKAQAAVAAVLFQAPGRAHCRNDVGRQSAIYVRDDAQNGAASSNGSNGHAIREGNAGQGEDSSDDSIEYEPELHVLCTTRAMHLSSHPGQASLPGGKCDHSDKSVAETAFRETCEEIGLSEDSLETGECVYLGTMRPYLSKTSLLVHPVAFWLPPKTASRVLASLYASPDEVSALWSYPLRAVVSSEPPRQIRRQVASADAAASPQYGEPLMMLENPKKIDKHRPPQDVFRSYSDVPWLLDGAYRLHRFRSTHQLIKGLTADVLMNLAAHAYHGTPWQGPAFPVFSPSQAPWDACVAHIVARNANGAPRMKGRWGDGESGDSYGSVEKYDTIHGQDWADITDLSKQRSRQDDEQLTRRLDEVPWVTVKSSDKHRNGAGQAQA